MQTKNLIIFFVLLLVIVFGWQFFVNWRWPPKEKPPSPEQCARAVGMWGLGSPAAPGLDHAGRLAAETWLIGKTPQELTELASLSAKAQAKPDVIVEKKPKPKPKPQRRQAEDIPLGDDSFNLKLLLTSEGAGVRELILTRFKEADRYGRYKGDQLPLIPNTGEPSFLLYHYDPEDDKAPVRPWETLGKLVWKRAAKQPEGENGEQSVSFETPAEWDEQNGVHITKTYSLKRADYHIGLSIKIRSTRAAGKVQKFRYQIAGPRGLPIEAEWSTTTFRNALIGRQNKDGDVERYLEDSRQIGL